MRLSTVIELLLILLLVAFAAYGRVIDRDEGSSRLIQSTKQTNIGLSTISLKQATDNVNRYCTCNENICNCCRDFHIPLVQLKGPGCASLQYLQGDNLAVQLSFGDNILTSTIVNGKSPKPVCVPLPGGFTKFCGRIYSIQRDNKDHFKACLGLELQSATELEASLRVSCFRFGPDGLKLRPSEPLPVVETETSDEDDDDDFFGLGDDDDDDDDDDDEEEEDENRPSPNSVPNTSEDEEDDDDDEDVLGLGALLDIITGDDETTTKKPKVTTAAPLLEFTIPILNRPTTITPIESHDASTVDTLSAETAPEENSVADIAENVNEEPENVDEETNVSEVTEASDVVTNNADIPANENNEDQTNTASNKVIYYTKPDKGTTNNVKDSTETKKKPSVTATSINAIEHGIKKKPIAIEPTKNHEDDDDDDDDDDDILGDDLDDDDDDDDDAILGDDDDDDKDDDSDEDDEEDEDEKHKNEKHKNDKKDEDEKADSIEDLDDDDDDDDEEDAVISALVYDEKDEKKEKKGTKNHESNADDDDSDYGLGLSGLLARKRHTKSARQSRIMRL